jgi:transcriptional regulator with XRE-family HTH domain
LCSSKHDFLALDDEITPGFGRRICAIRTGLGLDQPTFARLLGIAIDHLNALENETAPPTIGILILLKNLANVSADWILFGDVGSMSLRVVHDLVTALMY